MTNDEYTTLMGALSTLRKALSHIWNVPDNAGRQKVAKKELYYPVVLAKQGLSDGIGTIRDLLEDTEGTAKDK